MFELIDNILNAMDYILSTNNKRHMVGGILLSVSMLFGGLAFTVMTMKKEDVEDESEY